MGTPVGVVTGRLEGWVGVLVGHETAATGCCVGMGGSDGRVVRWSPKSSLMVRHWCDGRIDSDLVPLWRQ